MSFFFINNMEGIINVILIMWFLFYFCRQLKDKYLYTEHYNNQQNIPELLKAILQQNANVFSGPPTTYLQQGN